MIEFQNVSFQYGSGAARGRIENINLTINSGEVVLICGESGCGKTTVTRLLNGLVPHYYEGNLEGKVLVEGIDVKEASLYDLAGVVGSVFQNPRTQFFTIDSTSEIAFGCENLAIEAEQIKQRISKTAEELKIQNLLGRSLFALSGGEKQKIACASVSAMEPAIFVLDEPSSNLDIAAIGELKKILKQWKVQGKTIVIAEHRLYYLMDIADRVLYMQNGRISENLTIEEFRKKTTEDLTSRGLRPLSVSCFEGINKSTPNEKSICIRDFEVSYKEASKSGMRRVLDIEELQIPRGAIVGIVGNNGAGKTTFVNALCGLVKRAKGSLWLGEKSFQTPQRLEVCYMVMQDVNHQLFTESVEDEILLSLDEKDEEKAKLQVQEIMRGLNVAEYKDSHPLALSGGQKQRVAIASAVASKKEIIVFDEPTSGLDYRHMKEVAENIKMLSQAGKTVFIVTHDPELIEECCNYFVFIEGGRVKWSGGWSRGSQEQLAAFFGNL